MMSLLRVIPETPLHHCGWQQSINTSPAPCSPLVHCEIVCKWKYKYKRKVTHPWLERNILLIIFPSEWPLTISVQCSGDSIRANCSGSTEPHVIDAPMNDNWPSVQRHSAAVAAIPVSLTWITALLWVHRYCLSVKNFQIAFGTIQSLSHWAVVDVWRICAGKKNLRFTGEGVSEHTVQKKNEKKKQKYLLFSTM